MLDLYKFAVEHYADAAALLGALVAIASIIVKFTKTPNDDAWLDKVVLFLRRFSIPGFRDEKRAIYVPKERPLIAQRLKD